jgi:hypothetical protein
MSASAIPLLSGRKLQLLALTVVVLALALRCDYALTTIVDAPLRGDILQYIAYAWNLSHHGVFSSSEPLSATVVPDAYRGPGYALLLAPLLAAFNSVEDVVRWSVGVQILLSTVTVGLSTLLTRRLLGPLPTLVVGLLVASWPHLITMADTLLSETWFALWILISLILLVEVERRDRRSWAAAAGAALGFTYLINPLILFFGAIAGTLLWRRASHGAVLVFFSLFAVLPLGWAARNATLPDGSQGGQRVWENFVQGAWPQYHDTANWRFKDTMSKNIFDQIASEQDAMVLDPMAGLQMYAARFASEPAFYARWYFLQKPYLLWDWRIRIGASDISYLETRDSPYDRPGFLRATRLVFENFTLPLFLITASAALGLCIESFLSRQRRPLALVATAWFLVYVTAVHVALQAEPRYSLAYRPLQLLLFVAGLHGLCALWHRHRSSGQSTA